MAASCIEELLSSWIKMTSIIRGNRFLGDTSFNRMIISGLLRAKGNLTLTELCDQTGILKSQMNRLLGDMQNEGLVAKSKDENDGRRFFISLTEKGEELYLSEHQEVEGMINHIVDTLGKEDAAHLSLLIGKATRAYLDYRKDNSQ